ncbi:MAG: hypothetical protein V1911_02895 [Candidatus Micrarchaeota archaeon]
MSKKTEIILGFEAHYLSFVEKHRPFMEKADVILLFEQPPGVVAKLKEDGMESLLKKLKPEDERRRKIVSQIKEQIEKGKTVAGFDFETKGEWIISSANVCLGEFLEDRSEAKSRFRKGAELEAESCIRREERGLKWLLEHLDQFRGKTIYVVAGAAHINLYYELKKALKDEEKAGKVKVSMAHLFDERFDKLFSPSEQIIRILMLKKGKLTDADETAINVLIGDSELFALRESERRENYKLQGLTEGQAEEKAHFDAIRMWEEDKKKDPLRKLLMPPNNKFRQLLKLPNISKPSEN